MPTYHVGTSGWSYQHWRDILYPPDLSQPRWLEYLAERFDTVEVNATFYRLPNESTVRNWAKRVPGGFRFTFKASRYITHILRLRDAAGPLATFLTRVRLVGHEHTGAVLYQVPPWQHRDDDLLRAFTTLLPHDLACAFEFRHASWFDDAVLALLDEAGVGFCVHDMLGDACPVAVTGRTAYFRFHGPGHAYNDAYTHDQLAAWADRIRTVSAHAGRTYVYFNNDLGGHAIHNAQTLRGILEA